MNRTIQLRTIHLAVLAALAFGMPGTVWAFPTDTVRVEIRQDHEILASSLVTIGDIADVSGSSRILVDRVRALDLDTLSREAPRTTVEHQQIRIRIRLEGIAADNILVNGPEKVTVVLADGDGARSAIEKHIAAAMAKQFALSADSVQASLEPEIEPQELVELSSHLEQAMVVFPPDLPVGRTVVKFLFPGQSSRKEMQLSCTLAVVQPFIVAREFIPRGTVIRTEQLELVERPITDLSFSPASLEGAVGQTAAVDIPVHSVIRGSQIQTDNRIESVRRNDRVDVIINRNGLQLRLKNAVAQGNAKAGERIMVLNPTTDKQLFGTVVNRSLVEIE